MIASILSVPVSLIGRMRQIWLVPLVMIMAWTVLVYQCQAAALSLNNSSLTELYGETTGDEVGSWVSAAGDVNGDSYDDILVSSTEHNSDAGAVYLLYGADAGVTAGTLSASTAVKWSGASYANSVGSSMAAVGDVNNDGYDDIVIGDNEDDDGGTNAGAVYIIYGQAAELSDTTLSAATAIKFIGESALDDAGRKVAPAGDVNGDGYTDFLVAARADDDGGTDAGAVYLVYGQAETMSDTSLSATTAVKFIGDNGYDYLGTSLNSAPGDVNGDGYDDILIGASGTDTNGTGAGAAYLIYGQAAALSDMTVTTATATGFFGEAAGDKVGIHASVNFAGDINNDGYSDIALGAYNHDGSDTNSGAVYVVYGQTTALDSITLSESNTVKIAGEVKGDKAGIAVAPAGDIDHDGYNDFMIGAYTHDVGDDLSSGAVYVVYGQSAALDDFTVSDSTSAKIEGTAQAQNIGYVISSAGDVNHDTYADILIGGENVATDDNNDAGSVYVIHPGPSNPMLEGNSAVSVECADDYDEQGANATDQYIETSLTVTASDTVTTTSPGTYTVNYTTDENFFHIAGLTTRAVTVSDTTAPTITRSGEASVITEAGELYTDPGASVVDACDSGVTITASGTVDTAALGEYTITYSAQDASGNSATKLRAVTVADTTVPEITLLGDAAMIVNIGNGGNVFGDPGATASDSFDGDITAQIVTTSAVDVNAEGIYTITYDVTDSSGNAAQTVERTVGVGQFTISSVEKNGGQLTVHYTNGISDIIIPFGGKKKFRYVVVSDSATTILVTNGKAMKLYRLGTLFDRMRMNKRIPKSRAHYRVKSGQMYDGYDTGVFVSATKHKGKVVVFRISSEYALTKKVFKTVTIANRTIIKVTLRPTKRRIRSQFGKPATITRWHLTRRGKLMRADGNNDTHLSQISS